MIPKNLSATDDEDFVDVGSIHQIPKSTPLFVSVGNTDVILCRRGEEIVAHSGQCTHNFARLSEGMIEGRVVICPRHGARFDYTTGQSLSSLCPDLPKIETRIHRQRVLVRRG